MTRLTSTNSPQTLGDAPFDDSYSDFFEDNPYYLRDAQVGADYVGTQAIDAAYLMMEYPISPIHHVATAFEQNVPILVSPLLKDQIV